MDSKTPKSVSAAEAVAVIQSGQRVFVHSVAAAPQQLQVLHHQTHIWWFAILPEVL